MIIRNRQGKSGKCYCLALATITDVPALATALDFYFSPATEGMSINDHRVTHEPQALYRFGEGLP